MALYNRSMKKRNKFDITKWNSERLIKHTEFCKHAKVVIMHPLTFLLMLVLITYGFDL